jgi:ArsR family transcriptional regulator
MLFFLITVGLVMPSSPSKGLNRLKKSGICSAEDALKRARELKSLADKKMSTEAANKHSRFFKALADENRLRILSLLEGGELCVCEVMAALNFTQPTASHHLRILENAGVVKAKKEGKWVFYGISDPKLIENILNLHVP